MIASQTFESTLQSFGREPQPKQNLLLSTGCEKSTTCLQASQYMCFTLSLPSPASHLKDNCLKNKRNITRKMFTQFLCTPLSETDTHLCSLAFSILISNSKKKAIMKWKVKYIGLHETNGDIPFIKKLWVFDLVHLSFLNSDLCL